MIGRWWLTSPPSLIPLPQKSGDGTESFRPLILVDFPATNLYPHQLSKSQFLNINSVAAVRGLLKQDTHFTFMALKRTEEKNYII